MAEVGVGAGGAAMTGAGQPKIVLLSGNSLCHNPRVMKAATALARAGYDVHVLGAWLDPALKARDLRMRETIPFRFTPVLDVTLPGFRHAARQFLRRTQRKAANALHRLTGWESTHQLGFAIDRLFACACALPADLAIAHSEPGLHVASKLKRLGRRVGVDMEDWFSEDLPPKARAGRPLGLLRFLERDLLTGGIHASCPSRAMSEALAAAYGCKPPTVVYNAFPWAERKTIDGVRKDRRDCALPSIHWVSQTLGPGRGLEDLLAALPHIESSAELHLRGRAAPEMERWVRGVIPERWRQRVFFHSLVPNDELLSRIAEHDIGFAGEMQYCRSRDLTITNKILHYLLGGLAVVASETSGQREVASQAAGAVALYPCGNPRVLANALDGLLGSPERLRRAKAAALGAAERTFSWERQEGVVVQAVAAALSGACRDAWRNPAQNHRTLDP
jgi:glycosyltransferase involved in cell wall biosynthesis